MFTYHVTDKKALTVGERDRRVGGMIDDVRAFWEDADLDTLLEMEKADMLAILQKIAEKNSGGGFTISLGADDVTFEPYDERTVTTDYGKMGVLLSELYFEKPGEMSGMAVPLIKQTRPYSGWN